MVARHGFVVPGNHRRNERDFLRPISVTVLHRQNGVFKVKVLTFCRRAIVSTAPSGGQVRNESHVFLRNYAKRKNRRFHPQVLCRHVVVLHLVKHDGGASVRDGRKGMVFRVALPLHQKDGLFRCSKQDRRAAEALVLNFQIGRSVIKRFPNDVNAFSRMQGHLSRRKELAFVRRDRTFDLNALVRERHRPLIIRIPHVQSALLQEDAIVVDHNVFLRAVLVRNVETQVAHRRLFRQRFALFGVQNADGHDGLDNLQNAVLIGDGKPRLIIQKNLVISAQTSGKSRRGSLADRRGTNKLAAVINVKNAAFGEGVVRLVIRGHSALSDAQRNLRKRKHGDLCLNGTLPVRYGNGLLTRAVGIKPG